MTACLMMSVTACGKEEDKDSKTDENKTSQTEEKMETEDGNLEDLGSLNLWYADNAITPYLEQVAVMFEEENQVSVNLVPTSSIDYLEMINQSNIDGVQRADVFLLNSESLEKAYLAGLALELKEGAYEEGIYPELAVNSTVYQGKTIAYPFYFETEFLLYNKNFVETAPASFQEIIEFAQSYEGTYEGVESILKWDVLDLFYSYGFIGEYFNLGGVYGDDSSIIDLDNESVDRKSVV